MMQPRKQHAVSEDRLVKQKQNRPTCTTRTMSRTCLCIHSILFYPRVPAKYRESRTSAKAIERKERIIPKRDKNAYFVLIAILSTAFQLLQTDEHADTRDVRCLSMRFNWYGNAGSHAKTEYDKSSHQWILDEEGILLPWRRNCLPVDQRDWDESWCEIKKIQNKSQK